MTRLLSHQADNSFEEIILIGSIISKDFMEAVGHVLSPKYFQSLHIKQVVTWTLEYWEENQDVPGETIQEICQVECRNTKVADQDLIQELLKSVFIKYEGKEYNYQYLAKKTLEYIRERSVHITLEEASWLLKRKGADAAELRISEHTAVIEKTSDIRGCSYIRNFSDNFNAWFYQDRTPIMTFPGDLGRYTYPLLRGKLMAYLAPPKSGKSWHLIHTAYTAITQRQNVLFFSLEMSNNEVQERFTTMILAKERTKDSKPVSYWLPVFDCVLNQNGECQKKLCPTPGVSLLVGGTIPRYEEAEHIPCTACQGAKNSDYIPATWMVEEIREPLKHTETFQGIKALERHFGLDSLKILTYGIGTFSINDLESKLDELVSLEGWVADLVVLDYADLLRHDTTYREKRHQLGSIWNNLSRIAKERNFLLFTASQSNRSSVSKAQLESSDITEDFSKVMVVDGLISIDSDNSSPSLMRKDSYWGRHSLHWLAHRYKKHLNPWQSCQILHQFDLGQVVMDSKII